MSNSRQINKRSYIIDNAKLLCLFMILYCHIPPANGLFHSFAYAFHVPIFFFVAGVFFKNKSIKDVALNSAKSLLVPYFVFNLLVIICRCGIIFIGHYEFSAEKHIGLPLLGTILGSSAIDAPYSLPAGPSWFLMALFISRIFFAIMLRSSKILVAIEIILLAGIYFFLRYYLGWGIFSIDGAILGLIFLSVGYYAGKYVKRTIYLDYRYRLGIIFLCCLLLIPLVYINGVANMFDGKYGNYFILFMFGAFMGSIMVLCICSFIDYSNKITRLFIDGSTFFICLHMMIMEYVMLIYRRLTMLSSELLIVDKLIISIVVVMVCAAVIMLMKKYSPRLLKFK